MHDSFPYSLLIGYLYFNLRWRRQWEREEREEQGHGWWQEIFRKVNQGGYHKQPATKWFKTTNRKQRTTWQDKKNKRRWWWSWWWRWWWWWRWQRWWGQWWWSSSCQVSVLMGVSSPYFAAKTEQVPSVEKSGQRSVSPHWPQWFGTPMGKAEKQKKHDIWEIKPSTQILLQQEHPP